MAEAGGSYDVVCATLASLNLTENYEQKFKDNEMTDALVTDCLTGDTSSFVKDLIPVIGHQIKFIKEFSTRAGIQAQSSSPIQENVRPRKDSGDYAKINLMQEQLQKSQDTKDMNMFTRIADTFGWVVKSRKGVMKKIHAEAVGVFDKAVEKKLQESEYLEDDEMENVVDEAEEAALQFFEEVTKTLEATVQVFEKQELVKNLEVRGKVYQEKNQDQKKKREEELEKEAVIICQKYIDEIRSELGEGVIEKEQVVEVYKRVVIVAEEDYENQCGCSKCFDPDVLLDKLEIEARKLWEQIENRNLEIQRKTTALATEIVMLYEQHLSGVMEEDEFEEAHIAALLKIDQKVQDVQDLDNGSKDVCLETFKRRLDITKAKAYEELKKRASVWADHIKILKASAIENYQKRIQPLITKGVPVYEATLQSKHISSQRETLKIFDDSIQKLERKFKIPVEKKAQITQEVQSSLDSIIRDYETLNKDRWIEFNEKVEAWTQEQKDKYTSAMETISEDSMDHKDFEKKEKRLRDKLVNEFIKKLDPNLCEPNFIKKCEETLTDFMNTDKQGFLDVFGINQKENEIFVKAALFEAKKYYSEEMDKRFRSRPWYEAGDLKKIHDELLEHSIEACKTEVTLTDLQERQLREAFNFVYRKYSEDNSRRCPHKIPAIGIDLGTTYSCVGVYYDGNVKIIPNIQVDEKTTIPSYVAFNDDGTIDVGAHAKERSFRNPQNTIFDAKRLIGRKFTDEVVQQDIKLWPFDVVNVEGEPRIKVRDRQYRPEEISAKVLVKLKEIAENFLQRKVTKAVITVPAYFGDAQRKATKDAAEIAKLEATILNEPTAAAIAYQLHRTGDLQRNVLIFDLGGGTFDVAVLSMEKGGIEVKAIGGDTHLGGEDFDNAMVEAIIERVKEKYDIDLARDRDSTSSNEKIKASGRLRRLRSYCEEQKKNLSDAQSVTIAIDMLDDNFDLHEEFTREEFNEINMERFQKCIDIVAETLEEAKMKKSKVDDIVLVGGSTRIPKVQEMLKDFFEGKKELSKRVNADEAVAWGAAFQAALLHGEQVNDDRNQLRVVDVTPKSLGVAVYPDIMNIIIPRNTPVPCSKKSEGYTTLRDFQTTCDIEIYEGEDKYVKNNTRLGMFRLTGVPSGPAGQEFMECTMKIDEEGVLLVEAQVVTNGKMASLSIETYNGRMTQTEKEAAKREQPFRWA